MKPKSLILLALALGCGLVASIGISQVMDKRGDGGQAALETEPIFVASKDLADNEKFTDQNLEMEQWPKAKIPPGALTKREEWEGQRSNTQVFKGEPILKGKIFDKSQIIKIPAGYCTVSIPVDAVTIAGNIIKPHDKVDVLAFFARNPQNGINETTVKTILHRVEVFSLDAQTKRSEKGDETSAAKTANLLVTLTQAKDVTLAEQTGKIRLVLRNGDDATSDTDAERHFGDLGKGDNTGPSTDGAANNAAPLGDKAKGILDVLTAPKPAEVHVADANPDETSPKEKDKTFTMIVMEGKDMKEVEFNLTCGGLPVVRATDGKTGVHTPPPIVSPEIAN